VIQGNCDGVNKPHGRRQARWKSQRAARQTVASSESGNGSRREKLCSWEQSFPYFQVRQGESAGQWKSAEAGYGGVGRVLFRAFEIRRHGAQRFGRKNFPQGLKPNDYLAVFGTAEAVPFQRGGSRRAVEAALVRGLGEYAARNRI
jgi:hypothetical protein